MMRYGRWMATAALLVSVALTGCKINPKENEYYPKIAGNTFDLQNELAVVLPVAERINISYEFVQAEDGEDWINAEGIYDGPAWWFQERSAANPEQFLAIHLLHADPAFEEGSGSLVKLSRTSYNVHAYCIDLSQDEIAPELKPYIDSFLELNQLVSTDIYVRRFVMRQERDDHERTDLVYLRDVVRLGYTCGTLGDVTQPGGDNEDIIQKLQSDSEAAFEVMS